MAQLESVTRQNRFKDIDALLVAQGNAHVTRLTIAENGALEPYKEHLRPGVDSLGSRELVIGTHLAATLGLTVGDSVSTLFSSGGYQNTLRPGMLELVSVLASDTEIDHVFSMAGRRSVDIDESSQGSALALNLVDPLKAPQLARYFRQTLPPMFWVTDWTATQGNLYQAIQLSRQIVALMLASLLIIAMFNVVTSLVLVVSDRRAPSSMLRAIGLTSSDIAQIFVIQGTMIGVGGAVLGAGLGLLLALVTPSLVQFIELGTGSPLLDCRVSAGLCPSRYSIGRLPAGPGSSVGALDRVLYPAGLCSSEVADYRRIARVALTGIAISLAFFPCFSLTAPACSLRDSLCNP